MKNYIGEAINKVIKEAGANYRFSEDEFLAAVKQETWLMTLNESPFVSGLPVLFEELIATLISKGISKDKFEYVCGLDFCCVQLPNSCYEIYRHPLRVELGPEGGLEYGGSMTIYGSDANAFSDFLLEFDREIMKLLNPAAYLAFIDYMGDD